MVLIARVPALVGTLHHAHAQGSTQQPVERHDPRLNRQTDPARVDVRLLLHDEWACRGGGMHGTVSSCHQLNSANCLGVGSDTVLWCLLN